MSEINLTDDNFEAEVLKCATPVLVDFWAPWCGPCRMIAPLIGEIAKEYAGRVKVCKLNTDDCQTTASIYGISAIPTLLLFKDGKKAKQLVGLQSKEELKKQLDKLL